MRMATKYEIFKTKSKNGTLYKRYEFFMFIQAMHFWVIIKNSHNLLKQILFGQT